MSGGFKSGAGVGGQGDRSPALMTLSAFLDVGCEPPMRQCGHQSPSPDPRPLPRFKSRFKSGAGVRGQGDRSLVPLARLAFRGARSGSSTSCFGRRSASLAPRPLPRFPASRGFTLLELIVAIAVFAVVATMAYSGLDLLLRSREGLETRAQRQRELELAVLGIERDLRQALARPARGPYGEEQPALVGSGVAAEWTVLDLTSSREGVRAAALRVRYALIDGALWRSRDAVLDRSPRDTSRTRRVLGDVERIGWRFVAAGRQRLDQWPPRTGITAPERLPRAVEVTLTLKDIGEVIRLVELPESPR